MKQISDGSRSPASRSPYNVYINIEPEIYEQYKDILRDAGIKSLKTTNNEIFTKAVTAFVKKHGGKK